MRRYNHPTVREVAAIFIGEDGAPLSASDIQVWPREEVVHNVLDQNEHVDPLTYVLPFPTGQAGWHSHLLHKEKRTAKYQRLTATDSYSHRLMIFDPYNPLQQGAGMPFQEYVADADFRAEARRLTYYRLGQEDLRAKTYNMLTAILSQ